MMDINKLSESQRELIYLLIKDCKRVDSITPKLLSIIENFVKESDLKLHTLPNMLREDYEACLTALNFEEIRNYDPYDCLPW